MPRLDLVTGWAMSVSEAFSYYYLNVLRGVEDNLRRYSPSDANQPAQGTSSALDLTSLPGECAAQILALVGTPSNALVCKSWNIFSQQSYFFTAQGYEQDPDVRRYMPSVVNNPNNPSLEIVQKTYRAIINTTNATGAEVLFANLKRETPLSLRPVVRMVEDVNLIRFFCSASVQGLPLQSDVRQIVDDLNTSIRGKNPSVVLDKITQEASAMRSYLNSHEKDLGKIGQLAVLGGSGFKTNSWRRGEDRRGLTALPVEVARFVNLQSLDLNSNRLVNLPPGITKLIKLKSLNLSGNRFTSLPPEIFQTTSLRSLNFSNNQITTISSELAQLTGLTRLNISGNQITTSPQEIIDTLKLEYYCYDKNPFCNTGNKAS